MCASGAVVKGGAPVLGFRQRDCKSKGTTSRRARDRNPLVRCVEDRQDPACCRPTSEMPGGKYRCRYRQCRRSRLLPAAKAARTQTRFARISGTLTFNSARWRRVPWMKTTLSSAAIFSTSSISTVPIARFPSTLCTANPLALILSRSPVNRTKTARRRPAGAAAPRVRRSSSNSSSSNARPDRVDLLHHRNRRSLRLPHLLLLNASKTAWTFFCRHARLPGYKVPVFERGSSNRADVERSHHTRSAARIALQINPEKRQRRKSRATLSR